MIHERHTEISNCIGDHSFCWIRKIFRKCAYQVVRNVSFSKNFANVLNELNNTFIPVADAHNTGATIKETKPAISLPVGMQVSYVPLYVFKFSELDVLDILVFLSHTVDSLIIGATISSIPTKPKAIPIFTIPCILSVN